MHVCTSSYAKNANHSYEKITICEITPSAELNQQTKQPTMVFDLSSALVSFHVI